MLQCTAAVASCPADALALHKAGAPGVLLTLMQQLPGTAEAGEPHGAAAVVAGCSNHAKRTVKYCTLCFACSTMSWPMAETHFCTETDWWHGLIQLVFRFKGGIQRRLFCCGLAS